MAIVSARALAIAQHFALGYLGPSQTSPASAQFESRPAKFRASTGRDALARALCLSPQEPRGQKELEKVYRDMQPFQE